MGTVRVSWGHFEGILGSLWGYSIVTLRVPWGSLWGHFESTLESLCGYPGITMRVPWGHSGITLRVPLQIGFKIFLHFRDILTYNM